MQLSVIAQEDSCVALLNWWDTKVIGKYISCTLYYSICTILRCIQFTQHIRCKRSCVIPSFRSLACLLISIHNNLITSKEGSSAFPVSITRIFAGNFMKPTIKYHELVSKSLMGVLELIMHLVMHTGNECFEKQTDKCFKNP